MADFLKEVENVAQQIKRLSENVKKEKQALNPEDGSDVVIEIKTPFSSSGFPSVSPPPSVSIVSMKTAESSKTLVVEDKYVKILEEIFSKL